jgi:hypothetical protein
MYGMQSLLTSEDTMRVLHDFEDRDAGQNALIFALGAAGGIAIGLALSRRPVPKIPARRLGNELRDRARSVAQRFRPGRLQRMPVEQDELTRLEDAVLDAFLADDVLRERGVDVGAISHGIVELSGSVRTQAESDLAVRVASGVDGVRTVVNRLDLDENPGPRAVARDEAEAGGANALLRGTARTGGMGRRRQGIETDPDRSDDSQYRRQRALAAADRDQWEDEGFAHSASAGSERPGQEQAAWRRNYDESELGNQDPHGQHAAVTLDRPPEELNSAARVGEGLKPGQELRLEQADVPLKPHGDPIAESAAESSQND